MLRNIQLLRDGISALWRPQEGPGAGAVPARHVDVDAPTRGVLRADHPDRVATVRRGCPAEAQGRRRGCSGGRGSYGAESRRRRLGCAGQHLRTVSGVVDTVDRRTTTRHGPTAAALPATHIYHRLRQRDRYWTQPYQFLARKLTAIDRGLKSNRPGYDPR